ncbi:MAG: ABC transporter permease [Planctomycetota bacterium]|nr:ABC transporter permease [Planctomycetota bacterium]
MRSERAGPIYPERSVRQIIRTNLRATWARAYVRIVGGNREPSWLISEILLPLLSVAAYIYVYRHLGGTEEYTGFVLLGGMMTAYWLNILWSMAMQFYWEKEMGNLDLYLMSPISRMSILMGMALGGLFMTTVRAVAILGIGGLLFQVEFQVSSWGLLILAFVLSLGALYGMGMIFSSLFMVFGRGGWRGAEVLQEPVYLLSGFYFPLQRFGFAVSAIASLIPVAIGLDAIRQLAIPGGAGLGIFSVNTELLFLLLLVVLFAVIARRALTTMEALGKKEGRLSLRWQ